MAVRPTINVLGLCAGAGMLEEGVALGLEYFGVGARTVALVERDGYAAAALVARMEAASMEQCPVWDDVKSFDGRRWRGLVDLVAAGFPCQDLSAAGRRAGLDGARSGLFFDILRVADDFGAELLYLENV